MSDFLIDQAAEVYCHQLARIDNLGPVRRLVFTVPDVTSPGYQNVVIKLIVPADYLVTLAYMAAGADKTATPELLALAGEAAGTC